ncbi:hypothetical protein EX30DRAFT_84855 [Ascodesmis nigricans]|uniref:DUF7727 domain-containing protein n=1 Tax=Ascodesmis nigricans TaxID=341454 RepID=A0A4S2N321_9PEZI|nr:hypothetical protein EX30DRAFT_84855 [Ascodesmis nigricans]
MGRLIKNHLARLIILTAAAYQVGAGFHAYFFPKIFWDLYTTVLTSAVKPIPILQTLNLIGGLFALAWEWPLPWLIPNTAFHRSIAARLAIYPVVALLAALLYQGTNAALYYVVGMGVYFWAYSEGEVVCMPWKVPEKSRETGEA